MVSSNINTQYNVPMQALGQSKPVGIPMQAAGGEQIKQAVDDSFVASRMQATDESPWKLPLAVAAWFGLNAAADRFNKACRGDLETSVLGRAGKFGDKIAVSKFGRGLSKVSDGIKRGFSWLSGKSAVVRSLETPTRPEWGFAKFPYEGLNGFLSADIGALVDNFTKPISDPLLLEQFGKSKAEIEAISNSLRGLSAAEKAEKLVIEELRALGINDSVILTVKNKKGFEGLQKLAYGAKTKALGFKNLADFKKWKSANYENTDILMEALKRSKDSNISISGWRSEKFLGSSKLGAIKSKIFGRQVTLSELHNKLAVATGKTNATTSLGRFFQKCLGYIEEGFTGRFGGGKFIPVMFAGILAGTLISTFKAKKGERVSTFTDRTFNDFSYVFAMPFAAMGLHRLGGMKYKGADKATVAAYRKALAEFNVKAKAGLFADKAAYASAKKAVEEIISPAGKKFGLLTRLGSKIGRLINIGNETFAPYLSKEAGNLNLLRKSKNLLKNCVGVPLRLFLIMGVLSPFVSKCFTKIAHGIFGRPSKSVLDKEEEPQENIQQPNESFAGVNPYTATEQTIIHNSPTNLLNMYQNGQKYNNPLAAQQGLNPFATTNTTTNITNNIINNTSESNAVVEPVRTYIPSPEAAKIAGDDTSAADAAMARAMAAEKLAMETLKMM